SESRLARSKHHRGTTMKHYAGIDVSLNSSSVCVVDESGKIVREVKVPSEPVALIHCIKSLGVRVERIGLEAGPPPQWLYGALRESTLAVELLETRHVKAALSAMPVRPEAFHLVEAGGGAFWAHAEEVSVRRNRHQRSD